MRTQPIFVCGLYASIYYVTYFWQWHRWLCPHVTRWAGRGVAPLCPTQRYRERFCSMPPTKSSLLGLTLLVQPHQSCKISPSYFLPVEHVDGSLSSFTYISTPQLGHVFVSNLSLFGLLWCTPCNCNASL